MPLTGLDKVKIAIDKTVVNVDKKLRVIYFKAFRNVIKGTPVGNPDLWVYDHPTRGYIDYVGYFGRPDYVGGRARSNWFLTSFVPSSKVTENTSGNDVSLMDIPKSVLNKSVYLTNNLPYINALEYGHSTQAPSGWVRSELIRIQNEIRKL